MTRIARLDANVNDNYDYDCLRSLTVVTHCRIKLGTLSNDTERRAVSLQQLNFYSKTAPSQLALSSVPCGADQVSAFIVHALSSTHVLFTLPRHWMQSLTTEDDGCASVWIESLSTTLGAAKHCLLWLATHVPVTGRRAVCSCCCIGLGLYSQSRVFLIHVSGRTVCQMFYTRGAEHGYCTTACANQANQPPSNRNSMKLPQSSNGSRCQSVTQLLHIVVLLYTQGVLNKKKIKK